MAERLERIRSFLAVSYGDGDGDGYGDGYGDGSGSGYGDGDGDSFGSGSGYGDGSGFGDGDGIKEFNGQKVYTIDGVQTLIYSVIENYAKGAILNSDLTLTPCYIVRVQNCFAHGETLHEAFHSAQDKLIKTSPLSERIATFKREFPDTKKKIPARRLYEWHHLLTGSCTMGRDAFARNHGINIDKDSFTVREFIKLTCRSYGSETIIQLAKAYGINNNTLN